MKYLSSNNDLESFTSFLSKVMSVFVIRKSTNVQILLRKVKWKKKAEKVSQILAKLVYYSNETTRLDPWEIE